MIDIETTVFDTVADKLREYNPAIFVSGEYTDLPASFPAVTITQDDNSIMQRMRTTNIENVATLMYTVNVYTNTVGHKKAEAKAIMGAIDDAFNGMGFARTMCAPISNLLDATIYRLTARYEAAVSKNYFVYSTV